MMHSRTISKALCLITSPVKSFYGMRFIRVSLTLLLMVSGLATSAISLGPKMASGSPNAAISSVASADAPRAVQAHNLASSIYSIAYAEIGYKASGTCNKYSPSFGGGCREWCSDFVGWVWEHAGVNFGPFNYPSAPTSFAA
jgi:hypothetical protein